MHPHDSNLRPSVRKFETDKTPNYPLNNYPALSLRALAGVTGVTSAVAAYPVASDLFGAIPGGVVLASSAAAIYTGWHIVATSNDTDKRVLAGVVSSLFAVAMVAGIHNSAQLSTATAATTAASAADKLYQEQEASRMAALSAVTTELRATSKTKFPGEYASLQKQVDKLSTPTVRQATASQITQGLGTASSIYQWGVAAVFEIVTPALLLLAGMFTRRETQWQQGQPEAVARESEGQPQGNPGATQQNHEVTDTRATQGQQAVAPIDALERRMVAPDEDGNVTVAALVALTGCTPKQARTAFAKAVEHGILTKTGKGGATRYRYANRLRVVK